MFIDRLKDIVKDSSIYGLSKVIGQLISFFLIPLYTSYLTPEDYGILSLVGVTASSFSILMTFGMDSATYRYVGLAKTEEEQFQYFKTAQRLTIASLSLFVALVLILREPINNFVISKNSPVLYLLIGLANGFFTSISNIPRAYLRINRKIKNIALASILNIFSSICFTILFVIIFKYGVIGALIGNLIGTILSSLYINFQIPRFSNVDFSRNSARELLYYCLPSFPTQVFAFAIPLYSQWSVKEMLSMDQLGLYAVGLKFTLPLTVGLNMFQQSYAPYKYEILRTDSNPKSTFSKILYTFILVFGLLVLFISFFGGDILKIMSTNGYDQAASFIYFIALIPLMQGLYFMLGTGLEFAKSPKYRPLVSGLGLVTVILTNHYFINILGVPGAALSIACSWLVMAVCNLIYSQSLYRIHYNWFIVIGFTLTVVALGYFLNIDIPNILTIKVIVYVVLVLLLILLGVKKYRIHLYLKKYL